MSTSTTDKSNTTATANTAPPPRLPIFELQHDYPRQANPRRQVSAASSHEEYDLHERQLRLLFAKWVPYAPVARQKLALCVLDPSSRKRSSSSVSSSESISRSNSSRVPRSSSSSSSSSFGSKPARHSGVRVLHFTVETMAGISVLDTRMKVDDETPMRSFMQQVAHNMDKETTADSLRLFIDDGTGKLREVTTLQDEAIADEQVFFVGKRTRHQLVTGSLTDRFTCVRCKETGPSRYTGHEYCRSCKLCGMCCCRIAKCGTFEPQARGKAKGLIKSKLRNYRLVFREWMLGQKQPEET